MVSEDNISVLQSYQCSISVIKLNLATMSIDKWIIAFESWKRSSLIDSSSQEVHRQIPAYGVGRGGG